MILLINKPRARKPYLKKSYATRRVTGHAEHLNDVHNRITYGLRSVKQLARTYSRVSRYRKTIMNLRVTNMQEAEKMTGVLLQKGLLQPGQDPLALDQRSLLQRRLQTVLAKGLKISVGESRQLIVHGHVRVTGRRQRAPSFPVKPGVPLQVYHARLRKQVVLIQPKVINISEGPNLL